MVDIKDKLDNAQTSRGARSGTLSARSSSSFSIKSGPGGGKNKSIQVETKRRSKAGDAVFSGKLANVFKKKVTVEKKETLKPHQAEADQSKATKNNNSTIAKEVKPDAKSVEAEAKSTKSDASNLTESEAQARLAALAKAVSIDTQEAEKQARQQAAAEMKKAQEAAELSAKAAEEAAQKAEIEKKEQQAKAEELQKQTVATSAKSAKEDTGASKSSSAVKSKLTTSAGAEAGEEDEEEKNVRKAKRGFGARAIRSGDIRPRRQGKLTIAQALGGDEEQRQRSMASLQRQRQKKRGITNAVRSKVSRQVTIPDNITVQELASRMAERVVEVIKFLANQGSVLKASDIIDAETAQLVAEELGHTVKRVSESDVEAHLLTNGKDPEFYQPRSPVVTIMGHVDHGKTSLLDALKESNVVASESGGITQHIGAYRVSLPAGDVTFIDTPGHEAFTAMRVRGANVTDIVILVVAADDGVKPQTKEAISHAQAAGVPIIVAINKIDLPDANPQQVRNELSQAGVYLESMGGDIIEVEISALKKTNLDKLLEMILLQAELMELAADPRCRCSGIVIESKLEKGRGPVVTLLVKQGTLLKGDVILAGTKWGKVRNLRNDKGRIMDSAGPSIPIEIDGLSGSPLAGDDFFVIETEAQAREISEWRETKVLKTTWAEGLRVISSDDPSSIFAISSATEFPVIIKADVQGAVEAVQQMIAKFDPNAVRMKVLLAGAGPISENDVNLADASKALILGFNVGIQGAAENLANKNGVKIIKSKIIFELLDDAKAFISGELDPEEVETLIGKAEVLETFTNSRFGKVAGCTVNSGMIQRDAMARVLRGSNNLFNGPIISLRRYKDEVNEVSNGLECGLAVKDFRDFQVGDEIECLVVKHVAREL